MKSTLPKKTSILYWFSYFLFAILPITINAQTVPGAPTIGSATATGATSATVSFTAPTNNGGSAILRYVATSSPGGITGTFTGAGSGTITNKYAFVTEATAGKVGVGTNAPTSQFHVANSGATATGKALVNFD